MIGHSGGQVGCIRIDGVDYYDEHFCRALLARSDDLLEALKEALDQIRDSDGYTATVEAAIAKAEDKDQWHT